jgi:hypothetical protein
MPSLSLILLGLMYGYFLLAVSMITLLPSSFESKTDQGL